ncbi:MAG: hypothetical protein Q9219_001518 [cf. Caloplaca sp. 3 TL-2023]
MSTIRLTFLYPRLFNSQKLQEPIATYRPLRDGKPQRQKAGFSSTARIKEETYAQRYGSATEPQLPPPDPQPPVPNDLGRDSSLAGAIEKEVKAPPLKQEEKKAEQPIQKHTAQSKADPHKPPSTSPSNPPPPTDKTPPNLSASAPPHLSKEPPTSETSSTSQKPLATVLNRSSPSPQPHNDDNPPKPLHHLHAPRYIHHFDTYTLVQSLQRTAAFTPHQSTTLMKAVRGLLAQNLSTARASLVSKSDVENATYLFRAACSELRTEIASARRANARQAATRLAHLTHEADILSQRLAQEASALRDSLRGALDDRRMAVRADQQAMEQAVQELNSKITVRLMSGSKSEVEALRWVLTRRAAMAIAGMALLILGSLRYTTYKLHVRELEEKVKAERARAEGSAGGGGGGGSGGTFTVSSREMGTQTGTTDTEAMLANVSKDGSPAYVSLG